MWPRAVLLTLALAVHWPFGRADFSGDDRDFVLDNASLHGAAATLAAFAAPFPPHQPERALYRPLTNLSYAIDLRLGTGPAAFHRTNTLLYALVVLLAHEWMRRLLGSEAIAFAAALLFAVHPVHCDAVDSISGRSEVLGLGFALLALLALLPRACGAAAPSPRAQAVSAACYLFAALSKESASILPGVLFAQLWAAGNRGDRSASPRPPLGALLRSLAPHAVVLLLYTLLRSYALGRFGPAAGPLLGADALTRFATMGAVFWQDFVLLAFPLRLATDIVYQNQIGVLSTPTLASGLGWALLLVLLAFAAHEILRHAGSARSGPPAAHSDRAARLCGIALCLGFLFPVSHLLPIGALLAERFLFAPSLGFLVALAGGLRPLARRHPGIVRWRPLGFALLSALALAGALHSRERADDWRDALRLWQVSAARAPDDLRIRANIASVRLERGEFDEARRELEEILARDPHQRLALGNLALLDLQQGRSAEGIRILEDLVARDPLDTLSWMHLALAEARRGRRDAAIERLDRALSHQPGSQPLRSLREGLAAQRAGAGAGSR